MPDGHLKILIVEDNAVDRAIWRRHLSRPVDDFECWEVETGEAGLERCVEFRPDCIFLDFNLRT
jgi:CheY-like chemotaxis protein